MLVVRSVAVCWRHAHQCRCRSSHTGITTQLRDEIGRGLTPGWYIIAQWKTPQRRRVALPRSIDVEPAKKIRSEQTTTELRINIPERIVQHHAKSRRHDQSRRAKTPG